MSETFVDETNSFATLRAIDGAEREVDFDLYNPSMTAVRAGEEIVAITLMDTGLSDTLEIYRQRESMGYLPYIYDTLVAQQLRAMVKDRAGQDALSPDQKPVYLGYLLYLKEADLADFERELVEDLNRVRLFVHALNERDKARFYRHYEYKFKYMFVALARRYNFMTLDEVVAKFESGDPLPESDPVPGGSDTDPDPAPEPGPGPTPDPDPPAADPRLREYALVALDAVAEDPSLTPDTIMYRVDQIARRMLQRYG